MTSHTTHEPLRKALHIGFGLCAFALRFLTWQIAAAVALVALIGNWLVLHRVVGKRVARHERGFDSGIVLYPFAVLVLIVAFRDRLEIAGAVWAILAFGDGFATLAGQLIRGPRLPWNREKTYSGMIAFLAFGFVGAEVVWMAIAGNAPLMIIGLVVAICAIVESLPLNVDDNFVVPLAGGIAFALLLMMRSTPLVHQDMNWLIGNTVLAILGYAARSVDVSGMLVGWLLGSILIVFGGWQLYVVLLAFFVIGTVMTKVGYRRKAALGLAQEKGGRRGASHAFSNVGVAAILALVSAASQEHVFWFAAAAALATAAADTTASEVGQLLGRRTFLPLTFRRVPVGTEGAISIEGTVAGLASAIAVAFVATRNLRIAAMLAVAAFLGSYIESIAGSWNRKREKSVPNGALNFFNTAVGAGVFLAIATLVR